MTQPPLLQPFLQELDQALEDVGLVRVADLVWAERDPTGPIAARAAITWSDVSARRQSFAVSAFAGITILPLEQLLERTWPDPREPFAPAVHRELGSLSESGEPLEIEVGQHGDRSVAAAIAERFLDDALPWIESLRNPDVLVDAIRGSGLRREVLLPAILATLGRSTEAVAALDSELAALHPLHETSAPGWPSWASLYRQYSDALRKEMASGS